MFVFLKTGDLRNAEIALKLTKTFEGDPERGWVPAYYFDICDRKGRKVGFCDLRVGYNEGLYYGGNIGYTVLPEHRGHHYAGKACLLLFEQARKHGMKELIITCNPDNIPSRKTCEYVGGELVEIAELPEGNDMRKEGETHKCIYRVKIG